MKWYEILWQLPQWFIGYMYLSFRYKDFVGGFIYKGARYYVMKGQVGSVTFCKDFVFLSKLAEQSNYIVSHEYGHTVQSKYLGWLYLIIIGLPSIVWAFIHSRFNTRKPYSWWYSERWADKLGGV